MQISLADTKAGVAFINSVRRFGSESKARILLAVSGGPDSLAMLLLANAVMPERIFACTVDHRLRPEAAVEAAFVALLCFERNIAHRILTPGQPIMGNAQSAARTARYALLDQAADELDCEFIATAHHSDDQLETLLMRMARGSGLDGMAGIRARNGRIIRPVLGFTKAQLEQICVDAGVTPIRDPSNADDNFDRVAMRKYLAAQRHPFDATRAVRTASAIAEAVVALDWMAERLAGDRIVVENGEVSADASGLPREIQRRLLLIALRTIDNEITPRGEAVERLLDNLSSGRTMTIGDILCKGGSIWRLSPAPPRRRPQKSSDF